MLVVARKTKDSRTESKWEKLKKYELQIEERWKVKAGIAQVSGIHWIKFVSLPKKWVSWGKENK